MFLEYLPNENSYEAHSEKLQTNVVISKDIRFCVAPLGLKKT